MKSANTTPEHHNKKQPSTLINLGFNVIIPTVIMMKASGEEYLGPMWAIVIALAFPISYGMKEYYDHRKTNLFSVLGIISVLLTGGISLLKLDPQYIAIKEAAIPALFGIATVVSLYTRYPLVRTFLFNDQIMQVDKIKAALQLHNNVGAFEQKLKNASYMIAGSFFLSSVLNFLLAKWVLVSPPGTSEYTEELGKMTALSFPVIAVPSTIILMAALFYLIKQIQKMTHLDTEDIFNEV